MVYSVLNSSEKLLQKHAAAILDGNKADANYANKVLKTLGVENTERPSRTELINLNKVRKYSNKLFTWLDSLSREGAYKKKKELLEKFSTQVNPKNPRYQSEQDFKTALTRIHNTAYKSLDSYMHAEDTDSFQSTVYRVVKTIIGLENPKLFSKKKQLAEDFIKFLDKYYKLAKEKIGYNNRSKQELKVKSINTAEVKIGLNTVFDKLQELKSAGNIRLEKRRSKSNLSLPIISMVLIDNTRDTELAAINYINYPDETPYLASLELNKDEINKSAGLVEDEKIELSSKEPVLYQGMQDCFNLTETQASKPALEITKKLLALFPDFKLEEHL